MFSHYKSPHLYDAENQPRHVEREEDDHQHHHHLPNTVSSSSHPKKVTGHICRRFFSSNFQTGLAKSTHLSS
jgi:hypothetical protein